MRRAIWLASFAAEGKPDQVVGPDELLLGVITVKDENVQRLFETYGLDPLRFVEQNDLQLPTGREDLATAATLGEDSLKVLDRCASLARSRGVETFTVTHMLGAIFHMEGGLVAKLRRKLGLGYHEGLWLMNLLIMDAWSVIGHMGQNRLCPVQPHELGTLLRSLGQGFVRYPERLEPVLPAGSRVLLFWEEPSFADHRSWSLFEDGQLLRPRGYMGSIFRRLAISKPSCRDPECGQDTTGDLLEARAA